jgi:hypothetical protein
VRKRNGSLVHPKRDEGINVTSGNDDGRKYPRKEKVVTEASASYL